MKKHLICFLVILLCAVNINALTFAGGFSGFKPLSPLSPIAPSDANGSNNTNAKGQLDIMIGYAGMYLGDFKSERQSYMYSSPYTSSSSSSQTSAFCNMFDMQVRYAFANGLYVSVAGGVGGGSIGLSYYATGGFGYKLVRTKLFDASVGLRLGAVGYIWHEFPSNRGGYGYGSGYGYGYGNSYSSYGSYSYNYGPITHNNMDFLFAGNISLMFKPVDKFGIYADFDIGTRSITKFTILPKVGIALIL